MTKRLREHGPYKKLLSIFEIEGLAKDHAESPIWGTNRKGERTLEPWLRELRYSQALEIAEAILGTSINQQEFQACWARTQPPREKSQTPPELPNTATFGGYRLHGRAALNRAQKQKPRPKKK